MIYAVHERFPDNGHSVFFFDQAKVDPNKPFEVAYLKLLEKAALSPRKSITTDLPGVLDERCGDYQEDARPWTRLLAKPPCQVDYFVTVWVGD